MNKQLNHFGEKPLDIHNVEENDSLFGEKEQRE